MSKRHDQDPAERRLIEDLRPGPRASAGEAVRLRERAPAAPAADERPQRAPLEDKAERKPKEQQSEAKAPEKARSLLRRPLVIAAVAILTLVVAAAGYLYWDNAAHFESTDDAFIAARQFAIAPKVSGYLTAVPVTDNEHVEAGGVIARIDERDYRVALDQANAQVEATEAGIKNIDAQIGVQEAQIAQSEAQVQQQQAALTFAQEQASRYQDLAKSGAGTVQNAQQYSSTLRQQEAALKTAQAGLTAAQRQVVAWRAQRASAEANLTQARAQREQAELNLSYTTVIAAQAGRVVNLTAAIGQYASAGSSLTMFVPDDIWVTANFKETQLDAMRPGQPVDVEIDAYPERRFHGHVESLQPGSGPAFSLLPPENATGNYVKIVQRVPVKIVLDETPQDVSLGPGMSVVPTVRVNPAPSLYERLRARL